MLLGEVMDLEKKPLAATKKWVTAHQPQRMFWSFCS